MLGDLTGDGEITIVDVTRLNAYRLGEIELTEEELAAADINGDGKITMLDAARLNAYFKGVIDEL